MASSIPTYAFARLTAWRQGVHQRHAASPSVPALPVSCYETG